MASSSTSSVPKSFKYDVFLSFSGEDTRKNFVDHLHHALERENHIDTYKDDKNMKKGERISTELIKAIEASRFHIIIFSKSYASSSWCLNELVKIMECQKTTEQKAYPVFYDVEPTEVRKQSGAVGKAFAQRRMDEDAGKWRKALKEAADLAGFPLKTTANGHEAQFIETIVEVISKELDSIDISVDEPLVGMETRRDAIVSFLETSFDDVRMIGIAGIGGGGKTTLARAVFDQISSHFEGKSFVENVREVSKSSLSGLKSLQEQVLQDVLNKEDITVRSVHEGKKMMKRKIHGRKVLVVLDDVDHIDQLVALAGEPNWFGPGSRIIITTRDKEVLTTHEVNSIHDVNLLSNEEAIHLFNRFAFKKGEIPNSRFKELSQQVVRHAGGLPLTIKVLGRDLKGKDEVEYWKDYLKRLKAIPPEETLKQLELSYVSLKDDYKTVFLDVACVWIGEKKDKAIRALESSNLHPIVGLGVLERKSLVTVSEGGRLEMHDSIRDMGRDIVRREHHDEPHKHSRLWIDEEIEKILADDLGTGETRCMKLMLKLNPKIDMKGLGKMKNLRFLHLINDSAGFDDDEISCEVDEVSQYFPDALQHLFWKWYPFRCLPNTFRAKNLVGLEMRYHGTGQLWESGEREVLNKLKYLVLDYSMLRTLDLGVTPNLKALTLNHCDDLVEILMPTACPELKSFVLSDSKMRTLDLSLTTNLERLKLQNCHDLVELSTPFKCPKLKSLDLISCSKLRTLNLGLTPNLEELILSYCDDLVKLCMPVECPKLKTLILTHSKLRILNLQQTPDLETLELNACSDLVKVRMSRCLKLKQLELHNLSKLRKFDLRLTPNLKEITLGDCCNLVELHAPAGCLEKMDFYGSPSCSRLNIFKSPGDDSVAELYLIVERVDVCPLHPNNNLPKFRYRCYPSTVGKLEKLISVGVCACTNLKKFSKSICDLQCLRKLTLKGSIPQVPKDINRLENLEKLIFFYAEITYLPDSICMLKHLKQLKLERCWLLEKLPEDLGRLECLEKLMLWYCELLQDIPNSICQMKRLRLLDLRYCRRIEKLPEEVGHLVSLKRLWLVGTGIRHLPHTIFLLKGVCVFGSSQLLLSSGFTHARRYIDDIFEGWT